MSLKICQPLCLLRSIRACSTHYKDLGKVRAVRGRESEGGGEARAFKRMREYIDMYLQVCDQVKYEVRDIDIRGKPTEHGGARNTKERLKETLERWHQNAYDLPISPYLAHGVLSCRMLFAESIDI